ncbi:hypothetical protein [Oceanibium sediminis]|uniref:hypothetical protein n=1 Tax=Oceanibium sediminis TaxID=2026339 RepID=UPI000DD438A2|nr:hypothetical protein [Oceanibium sediminis]
MLQPARIPRSTFGEEQQVQRTGRRPVGAPKPRAMPCEIVALFECTGTVPDLPEGWMIERSGRMAALCCKPHAPCARLGREIPGALQCAAGIVRLEQPRSHPSRESVQDWMLSSSKRLDAMMQDYTGCYEIRLLLSTPNRADDLAQDTRQSQEEARLIVKIAQGLRDRARQTCVTPPALRSPHDGQQKMALSILVEREQLAEVQEMTHLAVRLARAHRLECQVSEPGPIESFPPPA